MHYFEEIPSSNHQVANAVRPLLQFCITKLHNLQTALATANDTDEILEILSHMNSLQLSLTMLNIGLAAEDELIINQTALLRSIS